MTINHERRSCSRSPDAGTDSLGGHNTVHVCLLLTTVVYLGCSCVSQLQPRCHLGHVTSVTRNLRRIPGSHFKGGGHYNTPFFTAGPGAKHFLSLSLGEKKKATFLPPGTPRWSKGRQDPVKAPHTDFS